jgi:hypothetical protein
MNALNSSPIYNDNESYSYNLSIALNHYNYFSNHDKVKAYVLDYIKTNGYADDVYTTINNLNKTSIKKTLGIMCKLSIDGFPFNDNHNQKISDDLQYLYGFALTKKEKVKIVQPKVKESKSLTIIKILNEYIETFFENKIINKLKISDMVHSNKLKKADCQTIVDYYKNILDNIDDPEYYGSIKLFNDYSTILNNIIDGFDRHEYKIKRTRIKKEIDPNKLVSKVKYLEIFNGYTSILPVNVLNAKTVLIYDVKYNTIRLLIADDKLTIRGSTIYSFNDSSICKIVKKPELFLKDIMSGNIQYVINAVTNMKTKERLVNGSLNANTIILRVL